jgi:gliding motility-associated-like protein
LNNCDIPTPTGSAASFTVADTVSAAFSYQVSPGCSPNDVVFTHTPGNPVTSWTWTINGTGAGSANSCSATLSGSNLVHLMVTNGACSAEDSIVVDLADNNILVGISSPDLVCPGDSVYFFNVTTGTVDNWLWDFGNGQVSNLQNPPAQVYPQASTEVFYTITLTASNNTGCVQTKTKTIKALMTCRIEVPTGFTPNNDGLNDYLYPLNGFNADKLEFKVYNRWGQLVFQTNDWSRKWDGKINGVLQSTAVFLWTLDYIEKSTGKRISQKGTSVLIR